MDPTDTANVIGRLSLDRDRYNRTNFLLKSQERLCRRLFAMTRKGEREREKKKGGKWRTSDLPVALAVAFLMAAGDAKGRTPVGPPLEALPAPSRADVSLMVAESTVF